MQKNTPLLIYSASAGSGKTFSLVQTYLKLTIGKEASPHNFSKIIAMTFTNKAAWEMKERIIEALDYLAFPNRKNEKEQAKRDQLLKITQKNIGISSAEVESKSKQLLSLILHNYEDFHVITIDKFSLKLIRNFARELDINEDFEVIINEDELIENVVDELLSKIGSKDHEALTKLSINYAKSNLDEGDKWNFRSNLIAFAKILKKEDNQTFVNHILEQDFSNELFNEIIKQLADLKRKYETLKEQLYNYFLETGIQADDLPYGNKGLFGYYSKLMTKDLLPTKKPGKYAIESLEGTNLKEKHNLPEDLKNKTLYFLEEESKLSERYFILYTMRKNFHNLSLLKYIANSLEEVKLRDNVIRISEFNRMISDLLGKEKAPFIYERLGTRFQHYLLDEFQDTSRLQWLNIIPLVEDSIASNNKNLIVGDPKQAIYRFRNGLVEQFVALPEIYNPENDSAIAAISAQFKTLGEKLSLKENWRSQKNIVAFNNTFFKEALTHTPESFSEYYSDVVQIPRGSEGGFVSFDLWHSKDEDDFESLEEEFILSTVRKVEQDGFNRGDICLLAKSRKEGRRWAKYLTKAPESYKIVSADSLAVSSDKSVQLFINYLELRKNPSFPTAQIRFAVSYLSLLGKDPLVELSDFWKDRVGNLDFNLFINAYFESKELLFFDYENLYDFGQRFLRLLNLSELNNPYLHHLMEMLQDYDLQYGPDMRGFYDFWNTNGKDQTVQMPENDSAIQIMTIHKAKGLEFPVVILPSLSWEFNRVKDKHFLITEEGELIHTTLKKDNAPDLVLENYQIERDQQFMDVFNMLYVALTRPVNRLYGLLDTKMSKSGEVSAINHLFTKVISDFPAKENVFKDDTIFKIGEEKPIKQKELEKSVVFEPKDISDLLWFPDMTLQDDDALEKEDLNEEQRFGNQMHLLLSKVKSADEIEDLAQDLLKNDQIESLFFDELVKKCHAIFDLSDYNKLFKDYETILSEQDIICGESETKRPDKLFINGKSALVLDYKTGQELQSHKSQLTGYVQLLKIMGFEFVEGVLLYTNELKMSRVF